MARAFVAFDLPGDVREALAASRPAVEGEVGQARWVPVASQHLTLRFLGDVEAVILAETAGELRERLGGVSPVGIELAGTGFFPGRHRPRVAWIGGNATGIEPVLVAVDRAFESRGMPPRDRPWALHLTQARLRRFWRRTDVDRFLEWGTELELPSFEAREVIIFTSDLRPTGAVYTAVERIALG